MEDHEADPAFNTEGDLIIATPEQRVQPLRLLILVLTCVNLKAAQEGEGMDNLDNEDTSTEVGNEEYVDSEGSAIIALTTATLPPKTTSSLLASSSSLTTTTTSPTYNTKYNNKTDEEEDDGVNYDDV